MTKAGLKKFVGKRVMLTWRDPTGESGWLENPLKFATAQVKTTGRLCGFNVRGEVVIAASESSGDEGFADCTAIPLACIEELCEIEVKPNRRRR